MSLFTLTYVFWLSSDLILSWVARSGRGDHLKDDRGTEALIWISALMAAGLAVLVSITIQVPIFFTEEFRHLGLYLIIGGVILRFAAVGQLGRNFTVDVTIRSHHELKQSGLYHYVRHPAYLGSLLSFAGLGLSLNNWISLAVCIVIPLAVFLYRMQIEEKVLEMRFGKQYREYMAKTKRLIPYLF
jgi:protein-S-isoprenylcysteine O-methyltransferase Ste14